MKRLEFFLIVFFKRYLKPDYREKYRLYLKKGEAKGKK